MRFVRAAQKSSGRKQPDMAEEVATVLHEQETGAVIGEMKSVQHIG